MEKYLYLTEVEWVDTWINGGEIPISLASSYLSDERNGILTPDENLIHESPVPIPSFQEFGIRIGRCRNLTMTNTAYNGIKLPDFHNANYYQEDGLILSFCNSFSEHIGKRFRKKACVKILNIEKLGRVIDKQLGCKRIAGDCKYTNDHQRNHFLKSNDDSWQEEYRLFWRTTQSKWVKIPPGTAQLMSVFD
ncbi:hypothetical protein AB6C91_00775 [Vibrio cyclitrophicus]